MILRCFPLPCSKKKKLLFPSPPLFSIATTHFSSLCSPSSHSSPLHSPSDLHSFLSLCCSQGRITDAIDALYASDPSAQLLSSDAYVSLVECCSRVRSLPDAKRLHQHITQSGKHAPICHRLITMYAKCNSLQDAVWVFDTQSRKNPVAWNAVLFAHAELGSFQQARKIFELIPNPNITSWNAIITACGKHGCSKEAFMLFEKLIFQSRLSPNNSTYTSVLNSISRPESLRDGMEVHAFVVKAGLESADVAWAIINMYAKCGKIDEAHNVFSATPSKNVLCWAGMITACANNGRNEAALKVLQEMLDEGWTPTIAIYIKSLEACAAIDFLTGGKILHSQLSQDSHESIVPVANALILMYSKCRCLEDCEVIFKKMNEKDVFTWNLMMKANIEFERIEEARHLFQMMQKSGIKPNAFTFSIILESFSGKSELKAGESIHSEVKKYRFDSNIVVRTALVNMYAKCGDLTKARTLFDELEKKDVVLWTTMIGMYVRYGNNDEALDLFEKMQENRVKPDLLTYINALSACGCPAALSKGKSLHDRIKQEGLEADIVVRTAIMGMYARCGGMKLAKEAFDEMDDRDVVAWTALLSTYAQLEDLNSLGELFKDMRKEGVQPNKITYRTILDACSNSSALELGVMIHEDILDSGVECDASLGAALINMYAKCGTIDDVQRAFDRIVERDVDVWNLVIAAHVQHGLNKEAIQIFKRMCQQSKSVQPNKVTFVHVLTACSNAGLVNEARELFKYMTSNYGIMPTAEHFTCMVILLGKAGLLEEAESYIHNMPVQASGYVWMTMLRACKLYGDLERGERAATRVLDMDDYNVEACKILADMHAAACTLTGGRKLVAITDEKTLTST